MGKKCEIEFLPVQCEDGVKSTEAGGHVKENKVWTLRPKLDDSSDSAFTSATSTFSTTKTRQATSHSGLLTTALP